MAYVARTLWRLRMIAVELDCRALAHPLHRERLQHPRQCHLRPLPSVQDRLDDVGRKQGQAQDPRHLGRRDPLALGQFGGGGKRHQPVTVPSLSRARHPDKCDANQSGSVPAPLGLLRVCDNGTSFRRRLLVASDGEAPLFGDRDLLRPGGTLRQFR